MAWTHKDLEVVRYLDLNMAEDTRSTRILDKLVKKQETGRLRKLIEGRPVVVYGCGPSLENDINKIHELGVHKKTVSVAVDGAVKALLNYRIVAHLNVTDLDGDLKSIMLANHYGCITLVHAHAENIRKLMWIVPHLKGIVYGTTHSDPTDKVHNLGGFTDGDRAVHIVSRFLPKFIVLAGMDFGNVIGAHSGEYDPVKKPRGLRVGKMLIEDLASHSKTPIFNVTSSGENIHHVKNISFHKLTQLV